MRRPRAAQAFREVVQQHTKPAEAATPQPKPPTAKGDHNTRGALASKANESNVDLVVFGHEQDGAGVDDGEHWEMEEALMSHLWKAHRAQEMREIFEHCMPEALAAGSKLNRVIDDSKEQREMLYEGLDVIAYYTQAVGEQEREHMPCIGPSG